MEAGEGTASHQPWLGHRPSDRVPQPTATTIFPASAVSSLPLPPVAHPCALVTVPRAPSRASWGEGVTLITLGRERSGGQREEPLAAPPSPPPRLSSGKKAAKATCPGLFLLRRRRHHLLLLTPPPRAPPRRRVLRRAPRTGPRVRRDPRARAQPPPCPPTALARSRAPTRAPARALPRLTLRGSGRVKSGSRAGGPISGAAAAAPSPPPVRPLGAGAYGLALAARAGPEAGSLGASRASGEWRGLRASWVASRALHLPQGSASAPGRTPLPHPPPRPATPQPRRHLVWLRPVLPALLRPASAPASILGYSPGSPSTGHLPSTRWFRAEARAAPLLP